MIDWTGAPQFGRATALKLVLERLHERRVAGDHPLIVEIGTSYAYNLDGLGNATLAYAWYAQKYNARFVSIDGWQGSIDEAQNVLDKYGTGRDSAEFITIDGQLLHTVITEPIALLYEDGPDKDNQDVLGVNDQQNTWHLRVAQHADPLLASGSLVLFDDCCAPTWEPKGTTAVPWLLEHGYLHIPWPWGDMAMTLLEKE